MELRPPNTLQFEPPSNKIRNHFTSIPWCRAFFDDPTLKPFTPLSRLSSSTTFLSETLATSKTIAVWQSFYRPPTAGNTGELLYLITLGDGVNGHVETAHGGFTATLLDEVIGASAAYHCPPAFSTMTAKMEVVYKKRLMTPTTILCRGWLDGSEGRKIRGKGSIEDGEGGVYAIGEALFIMVDLEFVGLKPVL